MGNQHHDYSTPKGDIRQLKRYEFSEVIRGELFRFISYEGLFSKNSVDKGTKFFAEEMVILDNKKVLDLGCGYGVLGIVAKKICDSCEVYLSDINEIAVQAAKSNAKRNNVEVKVIRSNLFENIRENFDIIITYPPYSLGKNIIRKFIKESYKHLNPNGVIEVLSTNLYRYVERLLEDYFEESFLWSKKGIYRVYFGIKRS